jgi:hypothetical protein
MSRSQFLLQLAEKANGQPLPLIAERPGIRLPPEKYCLTAPNYKIDPKATLDAWKKKNSSQSAADKRPAHEGAKTTRSDPAPRTATDDTAVLFGITASLTKTNDDEDYDMEDTTS